jgi:hypothetical protein
MLFSVIHPAAKWTDIDGRPHDIYHGDTIVGLT